MKRQIPFLHAQAKADKSIVWHWKPSPRLRKFGWNNRCLGPDRDSAILAALAINQQLAEWEAGASITTTRSAPRRHNFADLVTEYRRSAEYGLLRASTRREYETRLRFLQSWALDGKLALDALDRQMVRDLRAAILAPAADGKAASLYRAGSILRVLRLLLNWAKNEKGWLVTNPATDVAIPAAASRSTLLLPDEVAAAAAAAVALGFPSLGLGFTLGLWTLQRESDLLALNRMAWRAFDDLAPADRAVLANPAGTVMGFRLRQLKTGKWVDCPVPPFLHDRIEAAFATSQWLLPDDLQTARACPDYLFQRRARKALASAGLNDRQVRDLRRSGMTMLSQLGAELPGITAISGHAVLGRKTILDTYMPGNTRAACAAMAQALRTLAAREAREGQGNG